MTKELTKQEESGRKKKILPCTIKKRNLIIKTYRRTKGSIIGISRSTGISKSRIYEIFDDFPNLRKEIDSIDEDSIEGLKENALIGLKKNVKAGLQDAIKYAFDKEPRKERGKIVVNKDQIPMPNFELYLGVNQKVIIE